MRRLIPLLVLLCLCRAIPVDAASCSNNSLGGGVTCVQSTSATHTGSTTPFTQTATFGTNPVIHHALYVVVGSWNNGTVSPSFATPTDTLGNTYVLVQSTTIGSGSTNGRVSLWYVEDNISTGADTVSVIATANGGGTTLDTDIIIHEYSGLLNSGSLDKKNANSASGASSINTGNVTTNSTTELIFTYAYDQTSAVTLNVDNATKRENTANADGEAASSADAVFTSTGTYTDTWSNFAASNVGAGIASFRVTAAIVPPPSLTGKLTGTLFTGPQLPVVTPSVAYPSEAGYTVTAVASAANLQTAITAAACGTILSLAHDGAWTSSSSYTLPNTACACHTDPTKWVILRSDSYVGGSTRGARVDPSTEYHSLAHISNTNANYAFTALANGDSCYWLGPGLDIGDPTDATTAVITIGDGSQTVANYPHDFVIDHSYIHTVPAIGTSRCVSLDGNYESVIDSYLADCHRVGQDSQAILIRDGIGGFLVQNNYLQGSGENFLTGGVDPQAGMLQADMTFIGNHFFKPLSWRREDPTYEGIHWSVKNIWECKVCQRVLITGNVLENNWSDGQTGEAFSMKASNTTNAPQSTAQDINVFYNVVRHVASINQYATDSGSGGGPNYQPIHRVYSHDNLYWDVDSLKWTTQAGGLQYNILWTGKPALATTGPYDIWLNHETFSSSNQGHGMEFSSVIPYYGMQVKNSVLDRNSVGAFSQDGVGAGDAMVANFSGALFNNNCIYGTSAGETYNNALFTGVQLVANAAAVFVTPGSDFHVAGGSACHLAASDGLDMGANIDAVNSTTSGVVQTLGNTPTVTTVSPSTFTHLGGTGITITGTNFLQESGLGVIVGGAGPTSAISTDTCAVNTCTVVMSAPITLAVNDTVTIMGVTPTASTNMLGEFTVATSTDTTHFTYTNTGIGTVNATGGTANRNSPGNACTSVVVVSPTSITCNTPAASGTVTNGPVSVFVSHYGVPVQATTFPSYN